MFWLEASFSTVRLLPLNYSLTKIQIRKLGVGIPGSGLYWPHSRRDIPSPTSILPFPWKKYKRPSLSALAGNYKTFPGTLLKSVYVSWSPPEPLWSSTNTSILLHSWYLGLPPERFQTPSQKDNLPRPVLFLIGKVQFIAREIFQKNSL